MLTKLKVDFHTHSAEDPYERISYHAFQLIDKAGEAGFDVLAITNHDTVTHNQHLADYAKEKKILLIPGVEANLSGKHVLILNPGFRNISSELTLDDLRKLKSPSSLIIAPHPFFPGPNSLKSDLFSYLPLFDAIEYSHFYNHFINCNRKALRVAQCAKVPLVGSSDCHFLQQLGTTYTLVEAEKNIFSVVEAVKQGRIEIRTSPLSLVYMFRITLDLFFRRKKKIQ